MKNLVVVYDERDIEIIADTLRRAVENKDKVSFMIHPGVYGGIMVKRGESIWSPTFGDVEL